MARGSNLLNLPEIQPGSFIAPAQSKAILVSEQTGLDLAHVDSALTVHNGAIAARRVKDQAAQTHNKEMVLHAVHEFREMAHGLGEESKKARGEYYQDEVEAFSRHMLQLGANNSEGILRVSALGIAEIVALPVLPLAKVEKKKGFWERLRGE